MFSIANSHRSIRSFADRPIDDDLLYKILHSGLRSSSSGNMQTWSVIITKDQASKEWLYQAHRQQSMIIEAPLVLTFCADVFRMREWLRINRSEQSFDDLLGFLTGTVDAIIAAQTMALVAESAGLGICYLGTTWWAADRLIGFFELPQGVFPVTSLVLGFPAEDPPLRDRLPLEAMVHHERYERMSDQQLRETHTEREIKAWQRYNAIESVRLKLQEAGIKKVTDYYTSEYKYPKTLHRRVSQMLMQTLQEQGLWL